MAQTITLELAGDGKLSMSALGHKRTLQSARAMSALPRITDIERPIHADLWLPVCESTP